MYFFYIYRRTGHNELKEAKIRYIKFDLRYRIVITLFRMIYYCECILAVHLYTLGHKI